jgi:hypothetical protein
MEGNNMRASVPMALGCILMCSCAAPGGYYAGGQTGVIVEGESGSRPWGPARGERREGFYRYRYYQSSQVYYDTDRRVWFYMDSGAGTWTMAASLPTYVVIENDDVVNLDIRADRPYQYHPDVAKTYPGKPGRGRPAEDRGKGKGNGRGNGNGDDRGNGNGNGNDGNRGRGNDQGRN